MLRENVRISKNGWALLAGRNLANKVSMAIAKSKSTLEEAGYLHVQGTNVTIALVTSLKDDQLTKPAK